MLNNPLGGPLADSGHTSFIEENEGYSYRDLRGRVSWYCEQIEPGRLALIAGRNTFDCLAFYLACFNRGVPILMVASNTKDAVIEDLAQRFEASYQWGRSSQVEEGKYEGLQFLRGARLSASGELPCLLLPTSGSTGDPKVVKVSKDNLSANTESIVGYLGINEASRHITTLPFGYTYGLSCINTHVSAGASIVFSDYSVIEQGFWRSVDTYEPTTVSGVPYTYKVLAKAGNRRLVDCSIKLFTQAGGKLDNKTIVFFNEMTRSCGKEFYVMYGQTEATARMSYVPHDRLKDKIGSIGIAIPGGNLTIEKEHKDDEFGEILYSGPNVTCGYAKDSKSIFVESGGSGKILRTGDIGYMDQDGYCFIVGRKARFAKISGIRISLDSVESYIGLDAVAVVSDDQEIVVCKTQEETAEINRNDIAREFGLAPRLVKIATIGEIPRNSSMKVDYKRLMEEIVRCRG